MATDRAEFGAAHEAALHQSEIKTEHPVTRTDSASNEQEIVKDGIHDDLEFPTEEERRTLRRVADTIPWNSYRA